MDTNASRGPCDHCHSIEAYRTIFVTALAKGLEFGNSSLAKAGRQKDLTVRPIAAMAPSLT